jgi:hypothetical protein
MKSFSISASANTNSDINISAPNGFTKGCLVGLTGTDSWSAITIKTITAAGTEYPNRIRVNSSVAQTVRAYVLFLK